MILILPKELSYFVLSRDTSCGKLVKNMLEINGMKIFAPLSFLE
jgi:hypothetical protein